MRELRIDGTLILAVDHGYGNIKTANTVFSNGFVERDTEPVMSTDYLSTFCMRWPKYWSSAPFLPKNTQD